MALDDSLWLITATDLFLLDNNEFVQIVDVPEDAWYHDEVVKAVDTGIINGKTASTINPKDNTTRAEIAVILQRFIEKTK